LDTDKLEINHSSACGRLDVDFLVTSILKLKMIARSSAPVVVPIVVIDINSINVNEDFVLGICLKI
jgi:hypothetical protein